MDTKENFNTSIKSVKETLSFDYSVSEVLGDLVESISSISGQLVYRCELDNLIQTLTILKSNDKLDFSQLTDITAVDYPERLFRFELVYQLLSISNNQRVRIICPIDDGQIVPSITRIYKSA